MTLYPPSLSMNFRGCHWLFGKRCHQVQIFHEERVVNNEKKSEYVVTMIDYYNDSENHDLVLLWNHTLEWLSIIDDMSLNLPLIRWKSTVMQLILYEKNRKGVRKWNVWERRKINTIMTFFETKIDI